MKKLFLFYLVVISIPISAQKNDRISIEVNYGAQGNFFVRSYDERSPGTTILFYKKNFVGTIGGGAIKYKVSKNSSLTIGYNKSINRRRINYTNNTNLSITNFNITHTNKFFEFGHELNIMPVKNYLSVETGAYYLRMNQQEVDVSTNGGSFEERGFDTYKLEELGLYLGIHKKFKLDTRFLIGIRSRIYFTVSTGSFESLSLTPTLEYLF